MSPTRNQFTLSSAASIIGGAPKKQPPISFTRLFLAAMCVAGCFITRAAAFAGTQAVFYVDPVNGDDSGSGASTTNALRTLSRARDVVRGINASMTGDIWVFLRGGTYFVTNTIGFTAVDSGTKGYEVIYAAYTNEAPIISGGTRITGWTVFDKSKNIYQTTVDAGLDFRQMYVNGARAIRARLPNLTNDTTFAGYYQAISSSPFVVNASEVGNWASLNQVECVWISHWLEKRARLATITTNGSRATLTFMAPESTSKVLNQFPNDDNPGHYTWYYFENAYEFLDQEGEWYLNTATHTLFYKPRTGENADTMAAVVPAVETLVSFTGSAAGYIHDIRMKGILFECSNWSKPSSKGYLNWQDGVRLDTDGSSPVPGMVQINFGSSIVLERNIFRYSGAHALTTLGYSSGNLLVGNTFTNVGGGGIYINTEQQRAASTYDTIQDNLFDRVGQVYSDCVAIVVPNVANMVIEHNVVRNCPYTGISVGWSWNDTDQGSQDNLIQCNLVHDIMQLHDDGAGIYSVGRMTNGVFLGNYVYEIEPSAYNGGLRFVGFYLDNGSCYKTVQSNVCDRTQVTIQVFFT